MILRDEHFCRFFSLFIKTHFILIKFLNSGFANEQVWHIWHLRRDLARRDGRNLKVQIKGEKIKVLFERHTWWSRDKGEKLKSDRARGGDTKKTDNFVEKNFLIGGGKENFVRVSLRRIRFF